MNNINYIKKQSAIIINLYNSQKYNQLILKGKVLLKKYPEQLVFFNATALSLAALGKNMEAIKILNDALIQHPNNINILNNLGLINFNIGKNNLSREYLEKSLEINPNFIDALVNLANLNLKEGKTKDAIENLEKAYQNSNQDNHKELINLNFGQLYQQLGDFVNAIKYFEKVKKINPLNHLVDYEISTIRKYQNEDDKHLVEMKSNFDNTNNLNLKSRLAFGIGKAYEDLQKYSISFSYIKKGNKIIDDKLKYSIKEDANRFLTIKKLFKDYKNEIKIQNNKKIIFIVGMPRSGTTLVEQIISAHEKVHGAGELSFLTEEINKEFLKENKFITDDVKNLNYQKLNNIGKNYLDKIRNLDIKKNIITDKAPLNFRWIGFIKIIFPKSKIINCLRNPIDTCYSNYKNIFSGSNLSFTYDLKNLGKFYNLYSDLMNFWNDKFEDCFYNLKYETLINNQDKETRKLLKFCDLSWDENCLSPHKNNKIVSTASISQVRAPIYKSSINKWKNLSEELKDLTEILNLN